jgi:hypothetical protein
MATQTIPLNQLSVGTVLGRPKGLLEHQGIYLGDGLIFENSPKTGERISTFAEFSQNETVRILTNIKLSAVELYRRVATSLQKKRSYCPVTNNCEQSVNRIATGFAWSWQVLFWTLAAVLCIVVGAVMLRRK